MFENEHRVDDAVKEDIPAPVRAALWRTIRATPVLKDRIQVFRLSREVIDGRACQVIRHTQGRPHFSEVVRMFFKDAVDNFKIYCIDKGAFSVMQFTADD